MSRAIEVEGLGKRLKLGSDEAAYSRLTESLQAGLVRLTRRTRSSNPDLSEFWALRDISCSIDRSEVVGLIGHNGAGKTTLLRILSRISPPTTGWARLHGRVGSLLDVGTGFHPELTGRENVYLYGAVLGMRRAEVRARFDEIVEFAEVERFMDTPLKRYSSGMYLRLGFAVAAYLEPDILFVDEVLAVGDLAFQQRCVERMAEIAREGATIIFVTHNLALVSAICTRAVLLERGRLIDDGSVDHVLTRYTKSVQAQAGASLRDRTDRHGTGDLQVVSIDVEGARGPAMSGDDLVIRLVYEARRELRSIEASVSVYGVLGEPLFELSSKLSGDSLAGRSGVGAFECTIPRLPLAPGRYAIGVQIEADGTIADSLQRAHHFDVVAGDYYGERTGLLDRSSLFFVDHSWESVTSADAARVGE